MRMRAATKWAAAATAVAVNLVVAASTLRSTEGLGSAPHAPPQPGTFSDFFVSVFEFMCSGWLCNILGVHVLVLSPCGRSEEVRVRHAYTF